MTNKERTEQILEQLHTGIEELVSGDDWKAALKVQAMFHTYSFNNTLLIHMQRPDATYVGGMKTLWNKLGRHVNKGEKGIAILRPMTFTKVDEATGEHKQVFTNRYATAYVFDVTQTDGDPFVPPHQVMGGTELEGDADPAIWDALVSQVAEYGYCAATETITQEGLKGYTQPANKTVRVKAEQSELQRTKTLAHELAHIALGHVDTEGFDYHACRGLAETEAESVAFVVCAALGLATDDYSFSYVGAWSKGDMELVKKTGQKVAKVAKAILAKMEEVETA